MRRLLVLFVFFGSATCALFPSLGDLGPTAGEAGPDVLVEASADVVSDGGPEESGTDAVARDSGCAAITPTPTFCEDFDEPTAKQPSDLGVTNVNPGDQIAIDGNDFFSSPRSFLASMPSSTMQGLADVSVPVASSPPSAIEVAFEVKIDDTNATASGCAISQSSGTGLTLVFIPTGLWVQEGPFTSGQTYVDHAPHNVDWTSGWVKIDVKVVQSPPSETLVVNGSLIETQALDPRFVFAGQMVFSPGFSYDPPGSGAITARVDDLAMWVTP